VVWLLVHVGQTAVGIDVDCFTQYFYWTDVTGKAISRAKLDGTDSDVIVQSKNTSLRHQVTVGLYILLLGYFSKVVVIIDNLTLTGGRKGIRPVKKLSGGVLAWLSVWSKVQTCIWPS